MGLDKECLKDTPYAMPAEVDHTKFKDTPGRFFTPLQQCLFHTNKPSTKVDHDSTNLHTICSETLRCKTDSGFFAVGPALPGTPCGGEDDYCINGWLIYERRSSQFVAGP